MSEQFVLIGLNTLFLVPALLLSLVALAPIYRLLGSLLHK